MSFFFKTMLFRIMVFSCCFIIVGALILFDGIKNIAIYNASPIDIDSISASKSMYSHIVLKEYQVLGVINNDNGDADFFVIEANNSYLIVESNKGGRSYRELYSLIGSEDRINDYVINGYFVKSKQQCVNFLNNELDKNDTWPKSLVVDTEYSILLFDHDMFLDKAKIVFGVVTITFCSISLRYACIKKKKYYSDLKFWQL